MRRIGPVFRRSVLVALVAGLLAASTGSLARAQEQTINPTAADAAAANAAISVSRHLNLAITPAAAAYGKEALSTAGTASAGPFQNTPVRALGDLSYQGGKVVDHAESHAVYVLNSAVNCKTPNCWGNPEGFLRDLAESNFIHITDQYAGRSDNKRYTVGERALVSFTLPSTPLTDADILGVLHAVISRNGESGYNDIYHVFLPPGTDECFDSTFTVCYSPDKPSTFFFCAYHGSADFQDIGHVVYSVEPYANVGGCHVAPGSPNGQLIDSTNNTLSHELFEAITDPDGTAWWNSTALALLGSEIGDECAFVIRVSGHGYYDPPAFTIGDTRYAVQSEYNNASHACTTQP
jgi:hypothetical protein